MKICIVGPGALGSLFAALLAKAGQEVVLIDHRADRAGLIEAQGIVLHEPKGRCIVPVRVTARLDLIRESHLVFLCVKSAALAGAARDIRSVLGPDGLMIALQNGIAHHSQLTELTHLSWALGVTAQGATLLGPGEVSHGGSGPTSLGFLGVADGLAKRRLQEASCLLNLAGIPAVVSHDILAVVWNKLIVNAGINALTVMEDCANGELLQRPAALATLEGAVREAARVAEVCGIQVVADPMAMTVGVCRETKANTSSMLQDIRQGRNTEVEAINGAIVRLADAFGVEVPVNRSLLAGVKAMEGKSRLVKR